MRSQRRSLSRFSTLLAPEFSSNPTKLSLTPRRHKRQLTFRQPLDAHCTPSLSVPTVVSYCFQSFRFNYYPLTFSIPPLLLLISHLEHLHNHARFPMLIRVRTGALSNVASTRRPPSPSEPRLIPLRLISSPSFHARQEKRTGIEKMKEVNVAKEAGRLCAIMNEGWRSCKIIDRAGLLWSHNCFQLLLCN